MHAMVPRRRAAVATILCFVLLVWTTACSRGKPAGDAVAADGKALYAQHCAACHGPTGRGDGKAAYLLYPRPRDFGGDVFRIVSTTTGIPTDDDLLGVITRGMLGSAMPPHAHLPEEERRALVAEVRSLMLEGRTAMLIDDARENGEEMDPATARRLALREPGPVAELPPWKDSTPESLAEGKAVFDKLCASCHDMDGRGHTRTDLVDNLGRPTAARDLTAGILKGGTGDLDILRRVALGLPGSPMPASGSSLGPANLMAVTHYTKSLMRPGENERLSQRRTTLTAVRVGAPIDGEPEQALWKDVPADWISLAPLWWRHDRIEGVRAQCAHDGKNLAIRMTIEDPTRDNEQFRPEQFSDGAAVQLSAEPTPPFFAMGEKTHPVEIWYWRASFQEDLGGKRDAAAAHGTVVNDHDTSLLEPNFGVHVQQASFPISRHSPLLLSGWGAGNPLSDPTRELPVETLTAEGFGTLRYQKPPVSAARGRGAHGGGRWTIVLCRDLAAIGGSIPLAPGAQVSVGFAAWDGTAGDRDGQKNVSIWHRLNLAR